MFTSPFYISYDPVRNVSAIVISNILQVLFVCCFLVIDLPFCFRTHTHTHTHTHTNIHTYTHTYTNTHTHIHTHTHTHAHTHTQTVVLSIRGTLSVADAIVDGTTAPMRVAIPLFGEAYVHTGIWLVRKQVEEHMKDMRIIRNSFFILFCFDSDSHIKSCFFFSFFFRRSPTAFMRSWNTKNCWNLS